MWGQRYSFRVPTRVIPSLGPGGGGGKRNPHLETQRRRTPRRCPEMSPSTSGRRDLQRYLYTTGKGTYNGQPERPETYNRKPRRETTRDSQKVFRGKEYDWSQLKSTNVGSVLEINRILRIGKF